VVAIAGTSSSMGSNWDLCDNRKRISIFPLKNVRKLRMDKIAILNEMQIEVTIRTVVRKF
jgi:hypothetical protein